MHNWPCRDLFLTKVTGNTVRTKKKKNEAVQVVLGTPGLS